LAFEIVNGIMIKTLSVVKLIAACTVGFAAQIAKDANSLALPPWCTAHPFGLGDAQRLADQEVLTVFGEGTATFQEKVGAVWIFRTNLGYAGRPGPNIGIVEPVRKLPAFETPRIQPNNPPLPMPVPRPVSNRRWPPGMAGR
jgi:hypothetical protein